MTDTTARLAAYLAEAAHRPLPPAVLTKAKHHILDTLAACVSGRHLAAGDLAARYVSGLSGTGRATLLGDGRLGRADDVVLANAMMAHADETDDSHAASITHPGCAVVPAALAACEHFGQNGERFARAVVAGYDACARVAIALGGENFFARHLSSHAFGGIFGATAAAAVSAGFTEAQSRVALSYAAQQASGITAWRRDPDHIEKAYHFAGMPARAAVSAVLMIDAGFTGVADTLDGTPGFFTAFGAPHPEVVVAGLGERFEIMDTSIKRWFVGSPIQAPLDAVEFLLREGLQVGEIEAIEVELAVEASRVVDGRAMANVNLQHQLALLMVDGTLTFETSHDQDRMTDAAVAALAHRVRIIPSPEFSALQPSRQARVTVIKRDGTRVVRHARDVKGTPAAPMSDDEIAAKAFGLFEPSLGAVRARRAIDAVWGLGPQTVMNDFAASFCGPA